MVPEAIAAVLDRHARRGLVLALTGAGISAESGVPTFRGPEGYWTIGAREYQPEALATRAAFDEMPDAIWAWYLYRRGVCRAAAPNAGHDALVALERALGDDALVVTQNVDGLHRRAGTSDARLYEIHGRIDLMRCADDCALDRWPIPAGVDVTWPRDRALGDVERALLRCPRCGARARPHVLWFDESYDEPRFRFDSSLEAAARAALLVVVGTSGATTLPNHVVNAVAERGAGVVVLNVDPSPFTALADRLGARLGTGASWAARSAEALPALVDAIVARRA
jgi:NAD-dependent deacetylase